MLVDYEQVKEDLNRKDEIISSLRCMVERAYKDGACDMHMQALSHPNESFDISEMWKESDHYLNFNPLINQRSKTMGDNQEDAAKDTEYTNSELDGIKQIAEALAGKDKAQRMRMIQWAADKFCGCVLCHKPEIKSR